MTTSTWLDCIWYPQPTGISSWCLTTTNERPGKQSIVVADFVSEDVARHIALLHNEWWLTQ